MIEIGNSAVAVVELKAGWSRAIQRGDTLVAFSTAEFKTAEEARKSLLGHAMPDEQPIDLVLPDQFEHDHQVIFLATKASSNPARIRLIEEVKSEEKRPGCLLGLLGWRQATQS